MADIANPTGHVATYNDLLSTNASGGDVYITDDTKEAYQFSAVSVSWYNIGQASAQAAEAPTGIPETPAEPEQHGGTVGAAVPGTTTLDALVAAAFSTKSADLAGAISYQWYTPSRVIGTFPAATSNTGLNGACIRIYLEPSVAAPSSWTL